jgi:hypothetical protein
MGQASVPRHADVEHLGNDKLRFSMNHLFGRVDDSPERDPSFYRQIDDEALEEGRRKRRIERMQEDREIRIAIKEVWE